MLKNATSTHSGKWLEYEIWAKILSKHETTILTNGETCQSPVRSPSCDFFSVLMLVSKGAMMGATQDKMAIKKNGGSITLDSRKIQNKIMMFYLKAKRYAPEGQDEITNTPEKKIDTSNKK